MIYLLITSILCVSMLAYMGLAKELNIVDLPNKRSSHSASILKGGGIIFWFAVLLYFIMYTDTSYLLFAGVTLVGLVSFADDIKELSVKFRFMVQGIAATIVLYDLQILQTQPIWIVGIFYFMFIGILNAYNFMDGINGMTGLNSIVVLLSLLYVNNYIFSFIDNDIFYLLIIASIIFLFFNYRKKALMFAGDVGSISMGFVIIYLFTKLIIETQDITWLLLLSVYGVENVCTIIHRLYLKQNILKPHRMHLFQILSNEYHIDQRLVSLCYALVQAVVSIMVFDLHNKIDHVYIILLALVPCVALHSTKFILIKNCKLKSLKT